MAPIDLKTRIGNYGNVAVTAALQKKLTVVHVQITLIWRYLTTEITLGYENELKKFRLSSNVRHTLISILIVVEIILNLIQIGFYSHLLPQKKEISMYSNFNVNQRKVICNFTTVIVFQKIWDR